MGEGMRHLLAVDLDAPVLVVVPSIFGVGAEASSSGHALGDDAILKNTLVQDHGAHGLGPSAREADGAAALAEGRPRPRDVLHMRASFAAAVVGGCVMGSNNISG